MEVETIVMKEAGRGRGLVLPAWLTSSINGNGAGDKTGSSDLQPSDASNTQDLSVSVSSEQFEDATKIPDSPKLSTSQTNR